MRRLFFISDLKIIIMKIQTGKGFISIWTLLGIWSVSALTSLPGLAISPISDKLLTLFPGATELDVELLTTLPSLFIIPFILLAGYISEKVGYIKLLYTGLWAYLLSGILYFVCSSMKQLIIVSALLGIGAGIIIPLSTAMIPKFFSGIERTKQYGYISAITNITLVVATAITGYLADVQWRLPFIVYLLPLVSIFLTPAIEHGEYSLMKNLDDEKKKDANKNYVNYPSLVKYMLYYLLITYLVIVVSINLPYLMGKDGYDSGTSGIVISIFFLAMMLPGLFINRLISILKGNILIWAMLLIALGLSDVFFSTSLPFIIIGCIAAGFGYGMAQPYIYDIAVTLASARKVTYTLALVMTMNYVAILIAPFIIDLMEKILGNSTDAFPFALNSVIAFIALAFMLVLKVIKRYKS